MHVFLVLGEVDGWISSFFPLNTEKVLGKQTSCHISTHNVTLDFLKRCKHFCFLKTYTHTHTCQVVNICSECYLFVDMGRFEITRGRQALELRSNLSERRSLTDPILTPEHCSLSSSARNLQWAVAHGTPFFNICFEFIQSNVQNLTGARLHSAPTEPLSAVRLRGEGPARLRSRILQRHGHLHSYTGEARRDFFLLCPAYRLPWGLFTDKIISLRLCLILTLYMWLREVQYFYESVLYLYALLCYRARMWTFIWRKVTRSLSLKLAA